MKTASISEAKNRLSALIDSLKGGGSPVLILDRGRPVARLEPVHGGNQTQDDEPLARLIREGVVRPSRAPLPRALFTRQPPRLLGDALVSTAVIEERREGR